MNFGKSSDIVYLSMDDDPAVTLSQRDIQSYFHKESQITWLIVLDDFRPSILLKAIFFSRFFLLEILL